MKATKNINKKKYIICGIVLALFTAFIITAVVCYGSYIKSIFNNKLTVEDINKVELDDVNKLMIVAHPDDDTIWGGEHLMKDKYLVVCLTNGDNKVRSKEFKNVMEALGQKYIILDYPDKVAGKRSNWNMLEKSLSKDIRLLLDYKDWEVVVTHNKEGEYGHKHHIATNRLVTRLTGDRDNLWYFGKYYKKTELEEMQKNNNVNYPEEISSEFLKEKNEILKLYASQAKVVDHLGHMLPFENWTKAK